MEKNLKISLLTEFYGNNLTAKQYEIVKKYYDQNESLSEIAEQYNVSRQAISDILRRTVKTLNKLENNFKLLERYTEAQKAVKQLCERVENDSITKDELILGIKNIPDIIIP